MKSLTIFIIAVLYIGGGSSEIVLKWEPIRNVFNDVKKSIIPFVSITYYYYESGDLVTTNFQQMCTLNRTEIKEKLHNLKTCNNEGNWAESTICNYFESRFEFCFEPLGKQIEDCMEEEKKFLPTFFVKTLSSITKQFCRSQGATLMEFAHPCLDYKGFEEEGRKTLAPLFDEIFDIEEITKAKVCNAMKVFKSTASKLTVNCKSPDIANNLSGWLHAFIGQCDNYKS